MKTIICHFCQHRWEFDPPLGRHDECPACREDSRVCLNCKHYDSQAQYECREPQSEWVRSKNAGNFCGDFSAQGQASAKQATSKIDAELNALFICKEESNGTTNSRSEKSLEDLFKKEP